MMHKEAGYDSCRAQLISSVDDGWASRCSGERKRYIVSDKCGCLPTHSLLACGLVPITPARKAYQGQVLVAVITLSVCETALMMVECDLRHGC